MFKKEVYLTNHATEDVYGGVNGKSLGVQFTMFVGNDNRCLLSI